MLHAIFTDNGGHGKHHIRQTILPMHHTGDRQHGLLIPDNRLTDPLYCHGNTVIGGLLALNNFVSAVFHSVCNFPCGLSQHIAVNIASYPAKIF